MNKRLIRMRYGRRKAWALSQGANGAAHALLAIIPWYLGYEFVAAIYCSACLVAWALIVVASLKVPLDWLR